MLLIKLVYYCKCDKNSEIQAVFKFVLLDKLFGTQIIRIRARKF
jgi:hypothetical protein